MATVPARQELCVGGKIICKYRKKIKPQRQNSAVTNQHVGSRELLLSQGGLWRRRGSLALDPPGCIVFKEVEEGQHPVLARVRSFEENREAG